MPPSSRRLLPLALLALPFAPAAHAAGGMWTFEQPPTLALERQHGFRPQPQWFDHLRRSAVKFGASAAFVSGDGLLLTNHHVGSNCIYKLSTSKRDLMTEGYLAQRREDELRCPGAEAKVLESAEVVTDKVLTVAANLTGEAASKARAAKIAEIESACIAETKLACEVVELYHGAAYHLYRYRKWDDVRLVFAPEKQIAFFGGDPDNFVFPRFDLDIAFFRVYENGQPAKPAHFLKWSNEGVGDGDLVFGIGNPYKTDRLATAAQLRFFRDQWYPIRLRSLQQQRADLLAFSKRSAEAARQAEDRLFGVENALKKFVGEVKALQDAALLKPHADQEAALQKAYRTRHGGRPGADPWTRIAEAAGKEVAKAKELYFVDYGQYTLFEQAGRIVELAYEQQLPEAERLNDYKPSTLGRTKQKVTAPEPFYPELEVDRMRGLWSDAKSALGDEHPFVKAVLAGKAPKEAAEAAFQGTRLTELDVRKRLVEGGKAAVEASKDPLIKLALAVYPLRRAMLRFQEIEINTPIRAAQAEIGQLRFTTFGSAVAPDATGTLRFTYGVVKGYDDDGVLQPWKTTVSGLYGRADGFDRRSPFDLPASWIKMERALDSKVPFNFVADLDIIGGNSGSPVVSRQGELVGVVFDSNLAGLAGRFLFDDRPEGKMRALAVDTRVIAEALSKVYRADGLLNELRGPAKQAAQ